MNGDEALWKVEDGGMRGWARSFVCSLHAILFHSVVNVYFSFFSPSHHHPTTHSLQPTHYTHHIHIFIQIQDIFCNLDQITFSFCLAFVDVLFVFRGCFGEILRDAEEKENEAEQW